MVEIKKYKEIFTVLVTYVVILVIAFNPVVFGNKSLYPLTYVGRSTSYLISNESSINNINYGGTYADSGAADWVEIPLVSAANNCVRDREMPLWDIYSSMGMPIIDNSNGSTLAPLAIILSFVNSEMMWNVMYLVRVLIMMLFTFLFLREEKLGWFSSFIGGVIFGLSGYVIFYMNIFFLHVDAWLPMLMWATVRYINSKSVKNWIIISIAIAFMCLGGNPQNLITGCILAVAFYIFKEIKRNNIYTAKKQLFVYIIRYALAYVFAIVITMPYWLSFITLYLNGYTYHTNAGIATKSLREIIGALLPIGIFDSVQRGAVLPYIGVCVAILLISIPFSFKQIQYREEKIFLLSFVFVFILKIAGFPLVNWIGKLPILSNISFTKYNCAIYLCVAYLCAIQIENLYQNVCIKSKILLCIGVIIVCVATLIVKYENNELFVVYMGRMKYVFILMAIIIIVCTVIKKNMFSYVYGFIIMLELISYPLLQNTIRVEKNFAFDEPEYVTYLKNEQENYYDRVFCINGLMMGNMSANYNICSLNGVSPTPEIRYWNFMNQLVLNYNLNIQLVATESNEYIPSSKRYLDLLGVKYVLTDNDYVIQDENLNEIYNTNGTRIYHNESAFEKAFTVHNILKSDGEDTSLKLLQAEEINLREYAIVESDSDIVIEPSAGIDQVLIKSYHNNSIELYCDMKSDGLLVVSDLFYPGWKVYVDGEKADIVRTDDILRGVYVKEGSHSVTLVYEPDAVKVGLVVSFAGVMLLIIFMITRRKKEYNKNE